MTALMNSLLLVWGIGVSWASQSAVYFSLNPQLHLHRFSADLLTTKTQNMCMSWFPRHSPMCSMPSSKQTLSLNWVFEVVATTNTDQVFILLLLSTLVSILILKLIINATTSSSQAIKNSTATAYTTRPKLCSSHMWGSWALLCCYNSLHSGSRCGNLIARICSFKPQEYWSGPILMSGDREWLTVNIPVNPKAAGWGWGQHFLQVYKIVHTKLVLKLLLKLLWADRHCHTEQDKPLTWSWIHTNSYVTGNCNI